MVIFIPLAILGASILADYLIQHHFTTKLIEADKEIVRTAPLRGRRIVQSHIAGNEGYDNYGQYAADQGVYPDYDAGYGYDLYPPGISGADYLRSRLGLT